MDALSHVLFGRVLIALDEQKRLGPGAVGACLLGSILPDSDVVLMPVAWDVYLRAHVAGTHALVGTAACAAAAAGIMRLVRTQARFPRLFAAAWAGSVGHLFWDLVSGAGVRVGWPLFDPLISAPLVAMGDPFVLVLLIASALAIRWRRHSQASLAAATVFVLAGLLCGKLVLRHRAVEAHLDTLLTRGDRVVASAIEARWGSLLEWDIVDRTDDGLRAWRVDGSGSVRLRFAYAFPRETPLTQSSRALGTVRNFLRGHALGFPVEQQSPNGLQRVVWSDIRYCWARPGARSRAPAADASPTNGWPPPTTLALSGIPISCGIWFGGTFDSEGRALMQIVQIADVIQSRRVGAWF